MSDQPHLRRGRRCPVPGRNTPVTAPTPPGTRRDSFGEGLDVDSADDPRDMLDRVRWLLIIALVVWVVAVVGWVHRYGARSYLKLGVVLILGAVVAFVGFLILNLVWWAVGGLAAMLVVLGLIFGLVYVLDRRQVKAFEQAT